MNFNMRISPPHHPPPPPLSISKESEVRRPGRFTAGARLIRVARWFITYAFNALLHIQALVPETLQWGKLTDCVPKKKKMTEALVRRESLRVGQTERSVRVKAEGFRIGGKSAYSSIQERHDRESELRSEQRLPSSSAVFVLSEM